MRFVVVVAVVVAPLVGKISIDLTSSLQYLISHLMKVIISVSYNVHLHWNHSVFRSEQVAGHVLERSQNEWRTVQGTKFQSV